MSARFVAATFHRRKARKAVKRESRFDVNHLEFHRSRNRVARSRWPLKLPEFPESRRLPTVFNLRRPVKLRTLSCIHPRYNANWCDYISSRFAAVSFKIVIDDSLYPLRPVRDLRGT